MDRNQAEKATWNDLGRCGFIGGQTNCFINDPTDTRNSIRFSKHLKEALSFEEGMIHRINDVLALFLEKSDLPQEVVESIK
ncbi:MAG: hypothetical protein QXV89_02460, partial [Candidatus Bathyarchaeia archaeon]